MQDCIIIVCGKRYPLIFNNTLNVWEIWDDCKIVASYNDKSQSIMVSRWLPIESAEVFINVINQLKRKQTEISKN